MAHKAACCTLSKVFFQFNEDMVQILFMLEVLFTQDTKVRYLFYAAPYGSESSLFFSNYLSILDDFQHDFARTTDELDTSIVLAGLYVTPFSDYNNNQRLNP